MDRQSNFLRFASVACACAAAAATACTGIDVSPTPAHSVRVRIDSMGVAGVSPAHLGILIYADGAASVTFGTQRAHRLVESIRLRSTPSFELDVSEGDVHVEFVDGQLEGGGVLSLSGFVIGIDSIRFRAVGRHLLVQQGGKGIRVIDRGNARLIGNVP